MKKQTDVTFILDRSGSMNSIKEATIEGFNTFLREHKESKHETMVSLYQFDDQFDEVYSNIPVAEANYLNDKSFQPRGWTALLDAIGKTIELTKVRLKKTSKGENKSQVIVVILTDGEENGSELYSRHEIFKKIRKREEKNNWKFVFIGANQDAISEAGKLGISGARSLSFQASERGVGNAFASVSNMVMASHCFEEADLSFTKEDRKNQEE